MVDVPDMYGIDGTVSFGDVRVTQEYVTCMHERFVRRGPDVDTNSVSADGDIGLGLRRPTIIDASEKAMSAITSGGAPRGDEIHRLAASFPKEDYG